MRIVDGLLGHDIDHQYNNRGHRCLDIEDINLKNYILYLGDNVSLGLDKNIENTFPYIVSKKLKIDYYNLSIFNGGYEALKFNILGWMSKFINQPPKMIVITNEFLNSLLYSDNSFNYINVVDYSNSDVQDLIYRGNNSGFFAGRNHILDQLISTIVPVPIYQVILPESEILINNDRVINVSIDSKDQNEIAAELFDIINHKRKRVAP